MSLEIGFVSQTPALPSGAGVQGLGETFTPDLANGTGVYTVRFDIPNGPNDVAPELALHYSSAGGNGPFGVGWSLPLPRLLRSTTSGRPSYGPADTIVLEGVGPLVRDSDGSLRPEVDSGDWRIAELEPGGFLVTDRAGTRYYLGTDEESRIVGPFGVAWSWLLRETEDNLGGVARFSWRRAGPQRYLQRIRYGGYSVDLRYETRPDPLRFSRAGFELQTGERCSALELHHGDGPSSLVRRWDLGYQQAEPSGVSVLARVALTGFAADGTSLAAPELRFGYQGAAPAQLTRLRVEAGGTALPDLASGRVDLVDWNGDGLADVLEVGNGGSAWVWPNKGGRFGPPRMVGELPHLALRGGRLGLVDIDGDGLADLVALDEPLSGYQPRGRAGFERPVRWRSAPTVAPGSPSARLVDVDGDGLVDLLWSTGKALLIARRNERRGWGDLRVVGRSTSSDGPPIHLDDPHVFCADMTGDGTADIVRVDGGGVVYWPSLGSGGYGRAVRMESPPRLAAAADARRLFVVDVDGDGCADVVYVDDGVVRWWPNRTGAAFGEPREVRHLPTASMRDIRVADVSGDGSSALCWSVPLPSGRSRWFALDLTGGVRPYLLTSIDNSIGTHTTITYGTSAAEALRDAKVGKPWLSRHPFVLPVVTAISVEDLATRQVDLTRFRYHDGRFDPVLREVCGFGRVEQEDVGSDEVATLVTTRWFSTGTESDGSEPRTVERRRLLRAERGRLLRQERADSDGAVIDAMTYEWTVSADGLCVHPRLSQATTFVFEGGAEPVSWINTDWTSYDDDGNVTETVETSHQAGVTQPLRTLRSRVSYAHHSAARYRQRVNRLQQFDGGGKVVADTVTEYDHLSHGAASEVGSEGLITARWALALPDELVAEVYGNDPPDLAALGYHRRPWGDGWWVRIASYERVDDEGGLRGTVTNPLGAMNRIAFDPGRCHPERMVDAVGNELRVTFDPRAYQPTSMTDASGATSSVGLDPLGRVIASSRPGDDLDGEPTEAFEYKIESIPVEIAVHRRSGTDSEPILERRLLDGYGRLLEHRSLDDDGDICAVTHSYGPRGLEVRTFLPRRIPSTAWKPPSHADPHLKFEYDPIGRLVRRVRPDGAVGMVRYRPGVIEYADEADTDPISPHFGTSTRHHLDPSGRVRRIEEQSRDKVLFTSFEHDVKGALIRHTDAEGNSTVLTHDLLGRQLKVDRPESASVIVLDAVGNPVEVRTGNHRVVRRFDAADRLVAVHHAEATAQPVVVMTYHDSENEVPPDAGDHTTGRLVRVEHEGGSVVFDYDSRGRVNRKVLRGHDAPFDVVLALTYRSDDQVDTVSCSAVGAATPSTLRYRYDRCGRLAGIDGIVDHVERDIAGRPTSTRYANGVELRESHDPLTGLRDSMRLERAGAVLREVGLTYDLVGNLSAQSSSDPALAWTYTYDDLYRLVTASPGDGSVPLRYTYDRAGNMASASDVGAFVYGQGGAPSTGVTTAGGATFKYDERGHVTEGPWGSHVYDAEGRLRRIAYADGPVTQLTYDHEGRLTRRRTLGGVVATDDTWTPDPLVTVEAGELTVHVSDGEAIIARIKGDGSRRWLHCDHLGSLVLITDDEGAITRSVRYGPYGEPLGATGDEVGAQGFATGTAFVGGLVLLGDRWYCPQIRRFLSPDPVIGTILDPLAWNSYAYGRCNPTTFVDPSGRSAALKVTVGVIASALIIGAVVLVSVSTFGTAAPILAPAGTTAVGAFWGTVFATTIAGVIVGGVVGGLAVQRSKGADDSDVVLGVLIGAAVGGWAAFGGAYAGGAVLGWGPFGKSAGAKLATKALAGSVGGASQNAGIGFATAIEGGMNNSVGDWLVKMSSYALVGALSGAATKFASGVFTKYATDVPRIMPESGPVTPAQTVWATTIKTSGKALDKTLLSAPSNWPKPMKAVTGQGELTLDVGLSSLLFVTHGGGYLLPPL